MCICARFSFDISLCVRETVKLNKMWLFVVCMRLLFCLFLKNKNCVLIL